MNKELARLLRADQTRKSNNAIDDRAPTFERVEHILAGDYWGVGGKYWRGRRPVTGVDMGEVQNLFVSEDLLNPVVNRFVSAMLGRDPEWALRDSENPDSESAELKAVSTALSTWHRESLLHAALKQHALNTLAYGGGSLKVYIPDAYTNLARRGSVSTLQDALELIHVLALTPRQAGVLKDAHNRELAHWHAYSVQGDAAPEKRLELHTPQTVNVYNNSNDAATPVSPPVPNPLFDKRRLRRPRFMFRHDTQPSLITSSALDQQDMLNESWTNLKRNDQLTGFRTVITTNADPPRDDQNKPVNWTFGPNLVIEIQGRVTKGTLEAPEEIADPNVIVVDPVDPRASSIPTINTTKQALLQQFDQLWTELAGDVSAESRQESRRAFDKRVVETSAFIIEDVRWALETTLALAAWLIGAPERFNTISVTPRLFLDVERANLEVFKALVPAYAANLVSLETVVNANPAVEDTDAELKRINEARAVPPAPAPPT